MTSNRLESRPASRKGPLLGVLLLLSFAATAPLVAQSEKEQPAAGLSPSALLTMATKLEHGDRRPTPALQLYERVIRLDPSGYGGYSSNTVAALTGRIRCLMALGRYAEAENALTSKTLAIPPKAAAKLSAQLKAARARQNPAEAVSRKLPRPTESILAPRSRVEPEMLTLARRAVKEGPVRERLVRIGEASVAPVLSVMREPMEPNSVYALGQLLGRILKQTGDSSAAWDGLHTLFADPLFANRESALYGLLVGRGVLPVNRPVGRGRLFYPALSASLSNAHALVFPPRELTALAKSMQPNAGEAWSTEAHTFLNRRWPWEQGRAAQPAEATALEALLRSIARSDDEQAKIQSLLAWYGHPDAQELFKAYLKGERGPFNLPLWAAFALLDLGPSGVPAQERLDAETLAAIREVVLPYLLSARTPIHPSSDSLDTYDGFLRRNTSMSGRTSPWNDIEAVGSLTSDADSLLRHLDPYCTENPQELTADHIVDPLTGLLQKAKRAQTWPSTKRPFAEIIGWSPEEALRIAWISKQQILKSENSTHRARSNNRQSWERIYDISASVLLHAMPGWNQRSNVNARADHPSAIYRHPYDDAMPALEPLTPAFAPERVMKLLCDAAREGRLVNTRSWTMILGKSAAPLSAWWPLLEAQDLWWRGVGQARIRNLEDTSALPTEIPEQLLADARWRPGVGPRDLSLAREAIARWPAPVADAALIAIFSHDRKTLVEARQPSKQDNRSFAIAKAWEAVSPWARLRALEDWRGPVTGTVYAFTSAWVAEDNHSNRNIRKAPKQALRRLFARGSQTPFSDEEALDLLNTVVHPKLLDEIWVIRAEGKSDVTVPLSWLTKAPASIRDRVTADFVSRAVSAEERVAAARFVLREAGFQQQAQKEVLQQIAQDRIVELFDEVSALTEGAPGPLRSTAYEVLKALVEARQARSRAESSKIRSEVFASAEKLAHSKDPTVRRSAVGILARLGSDRALLALTKLSVDENADVRRAVADALTGGQ